MLGPEFERVMVASGGFTPTQRSHRARVDWVYALEAMKATGTGSEKAFRWLGSDEAGHQQRWRTTLLAELGRCGSLCADEGPRVIRDRAAELCEQKPTTARGVRLLRDVRRRLLNRPARAGDPVRQLAAAIVAAIDTYQGAHGHLTPAECRGALERVHQCIQEE